MTWRTRAVRVLHLDVDAFFAAVEQRDDPRLRGRPVAVGTGVVASCSYEAKHAGVGTGMRLTDARRVCRALVIVPGDYRKYEIAGRRILGIAHEITPAVEVAALDDLYLDVTGAGGGGTGGGGTDGEAEARRLAAAVRAEVGLRVSVGVAGNKATAGVATHAVKRAKVRNVTAPDVAVVPPGAEREYLAPWPVGVLPGVGPRTEAQLERLGVRRVGELAEVPDPVLCAAFGARGRALRELARGVDHRPVTPSRPPIGVSRRTSFDPPAAEPGFVTAMLDHLLDRALTWARGRGLRTRGLTVSCRYGDYRSADARVTFAGPTDAEGELRAAARDRLGRLTGRRVPLRLLGVELTPLVADPAQAPLFPDPGAERAERLRSCRDEIRERFGFLAVTIGTALELNGRLERDRDNYHLRTPCLTR